MSQNQNKDLLPCPFCGGKAQTKKFHPDNETESIVTECVRCRAGIIRSEIIVSNGGFSYEHRHRFETENCWNHRFSASRVVDELVEALKYYANPKDWGNRFDNHGDHSVFEHADGYKIAQNALSRYQSMKQQEI